MQASRHVKPSRTVMTQSYSSNVQVRWRSRGFDPAFKMQERRTAGLSSVHRTAVARDLVNQRGIMPARDGTVKNKGIVASKKWRSGFPVDLEVSLFPNRSQLSRGKLLRRVLFRDTISWFGSIHVCAATPAPPLPSARLASTVTFLIRRCGRRRERCAQSRSRGSRPRAQSSKRRHCQTWNRTAASR